jgi:hypothetical protein
VKPSSARTCRLARRGDAFVIPQPGRRPEVRSESEDHARQPGGVRGDDAGRQVRERGSFELGVVWFDDCVPAVGVVARNAVEQPWIGVVKERVEPPQVEQGVLTGAGVGLGVQVQDRTYRQTAGEMHGLLLRGERTTGSVVRG